MSANIASAGAEPLRKDIENLVRKTVEETLNAPLDEEASELVGAERCPRAAAVLGPSSTRWPTSAFRRPTGGACVPTTRRRRLTER